MFETRNSIKNKDVMFMEGSESIRNDLKMHPSERIKAYGGGDG